MVPTDEIMKYYTDRWYKDYELYFKYRYIEFGKDFNDYLKDYFLQVTVICHPSYYLNEINAYEAEMRMFPNLTGQYNEARLFKLWEHQQMYDISIEYYEKNNYYEKIYYITIFYIFYFLLFTGKFED